LENIGAPSSGGTAVEDDLFCLLQAEKVLNKEGKSFPLKSGILFFVSYALKELINFQNLKRSFFRFLGF